MVNKTITFFDIDITRDHDTSELSNLILDAMSGSSMEKMMMLMILVKMDKLTIDELMMHCRSHRSTGGLLSRADEIYEIYRGGVGDEL